MLSDQERNGKKRENSLESFSNLFGTSGRDVSPSLAVVVYRLMRDLTGLLSLSL